MAEAIPQGHAASFRISTELSCLPDLLIPRGDVERDEV